MRSSCSESRRLRSARSRCRSLRCVICRDRYQEEAATVASVMMSPSRRAGVGERPWARAMVTKGGGCRTIITQSRLHPWPTAPVRDVSQAVCPFKMGPHNLFVYLVLQEKGR